MICSLAVQNSHRKKPGGHPGGFGKSMEGLEVRRIWRLYQDEGAHVLTGSVLNASADQSETLSGNRNVEVFGASLDSP